MAQLIKLKDYISRYELDIYRYPSQYIRLKSEKWNKLYQSWTNGLNGNNDENDNQEQSQKESLLSKWNLFRKKKMQEPEIDPVEELPVNEKDLRVHFLNQLYPFQLKWATSSLSYVSFMDQQFNYDKNLKYFLQRFPDNYLLMYYPIFNIKKAPIDGEIILISPLQINIIHLLDDYADANIIVSDERTWIAEKDSQQSRFLSPIHALKRTEQLINSILKQKDISYSVKKTVIAKNNNLILQQVPYNIEMVGNYEYDKWFKNMRELDTPLKSQQLKVAGQLLDFCMTSSVKRPEWEEGQDDFRTVGEE